MPGAVAGVRSTCCDIWFPILNLDYSGSTRTQLRQDWDAPARRVVRVRRDLNCLPDIKLPSFVRIDQIEVVIGRERAGGRADNSAIDAAVSITAGRSEEYMSNSYLHLILITCGVCGQRCVRGDRDYRRSRTRTRSARESHHLCSSSGR